MASLLEGCASLHVASDLTCPSQVQDLTQRRDPGETTRGSSGAGHMLDGFGKNTICVNQAVGTKCMKNY